LFPGAVYLAGWLRSAAKVALFVIWFVCGVGAVKGQLLTFAGNAQHTASYSVPAQHLSRILWSNSVDVSASGQFMHYGAPIITPSNTVVVPIRLTTTGFELKAFDGATGRLKYTLTNDYVLPTYNWTPVYNPVLVYGGLTNRLYYAGEGGTLFYVDNPDSDTPSAAVRVCFYTNLVGYATNAAAYNSTIFVNTPLTADANGTVFFGFRVQGTAPAPLSTTQSGFARIDSGGTGIYVLTAVAAGDSAMGHDSHNSAPALSNDGTLLYVPVKSSSTAYQAYLLGLDSTTLATKYKVQLKDPRNTNNAGVPDDGTASPMVAPDGDVFFGVLANPDNGSRGFLLHFNATLKTQKRPSAFGWDYTPAIVPTNMLPGYAGTSSYLIFSKYNNYAGGSDGNGINRIALLDPNATQVDPHPTANGLVEMRELLTVIGPTADVEYQGPTYPYAVREWCINTAAVNPATDCIFTPSEDGRIYRWNLALNSLCEAFTLGTGLGEPYVPTSVGPDGTIYSLNGGSMFALTGLTNYAVGVYSSSPDMTTLVVGQPVTFSAVVTNLDASGPVPTGTVTFTDLTYHGLTATNRTLALNLPLSNGVATVTISNLVAGSNFLGNHFITANYNGSGAFPAASATLVQKVHAYGTTLSLTSSIPPAGSSGPITFTATVASAPSGGGLPSGQVTFWDGSTFLAQVPLSTNTGAASFTLAVLTSASHAIRATYASDTIFAASAGSVITTAPTLTNWNVDTNGYFGFGFSNVIGGPFSVLGSTDLFLPLSNWGVLGPVIEILPGQFQFSDPQTSNNSVQYYRVRSP
jgi:hypothetical protein